MRIMKLFTACTSAVCLIIVMSGCEVRSEAYATLDEARERGAFDRGWLPNLIPKHATDIREVHRVDSRRVWGSFRFDPTYSSWQEKLQPGLGLRASISVEYPPRVDWWPRPLLGNLTKEDLEERGFEILRYENTASSERLIFFFVQKNSNVAFFYQPS